MTTLAEHLQKPCDEPGCENTATHNQSGWRLCNQHLDRHAPAFARND